MLNDSDGHGGGEASAAPTDAEGLFKRLKRDVKADYTSKGQTKWRKEAREDFDFEAGEQLNEEDKAILQDAKRPIVISADVGDSVGHRSKKAVRAYAAAHAFEPVQDGRIYIEKLNKPFLFGDRGTPAEYSAGLAFAIERGWLENARERHARPLHSVRK
jgi:hypothetical protein